MATSLSVRRIDPLYSTVPGSSARDVVVLPRGYVSGAPRYHDTTLDLVKALKFEGLDASFAHDSDERQWLGEKSHLQYAIDAVIGILSAGAYDGIRLLLRRRHASSPVRLRLTRQNADGSQEWYELEGTGEDVAEAVRQLSPQSDDPELSE
ncbi:hypothetical protein IPZ64_31325 [Streptomyces violaceoruber]|uniref:hypothetical protein n=1 Tax=Streptomyces violaceoruber TaxID=1935 RepID=UPI001F266F96|nr:hypothetical protein [Streptomyces violaceoruber]MCF3171345.1 hypothetical protein [Streptomyces violaceoruber]